MSSTRNPTSNLTTCYCLGNYTYRTYFDQIECERAFLLSDSEIFLEHPELWEKHTRPSPSMGIFSNGIFPYVVQQIRPIFTVLIDTNIVAQANKVKRQFYNAHFDVYVDFNCAEIDRTHIYKVISISFGEDSCEINKSIYELGLKVDTKSYEKIWKKAPDPTENKAVAVLSQYRQGGFFGKGRTHHAEASALISEIKTQSLTEMGLYTAAKIQQMKLKENSQMEGDYAAALAVILKMIKEHQWEIQRCLPYLLSALLQGNVHAEITCAYLDIPCRFSK